jgi:acyl-CoA thioesterase I
MTIARRALLLAALLLAAGSADAASINIVALGASNTYGKGVARGQDYPSQLQSMLRAKGLDARVANAGINGDTTGGMLARLSSAVPAGTHMWTAPGLQEVNRMRIGSLAIICPAC